MRIFLITLSLLFTCSVGQAKEYYVYIDRHHPETNNVTGQNERGDVIDIVDAKTITPPKWDYENFDIVFMDLTDEEVRELLIPVYKDGDETKDRTKERKFKVDTRELKKANDEKTVYQKSDISITDKSRSQ